MFKEKYVSYAENDKYIVSVSLDGDIEIWDKAKGRSIPAPRLFTQNFRYLLVEWDVFTNTYITPDSRYGIITQGIGVVYFVDLKTGELVKTIRMFPEIFYDDNEFDESFYEEMDSKGYYEDTTSLKFSPSGKYAAIRVRGKIDPSELDGVSIVTPIYYRTVFVIDLENLAIIIKDSFEDVSERGGRNVASIAFSPEENWFAIGALGNEIKLFHIPTGKETNRIGLLSYKIDPLAVKECDFILFISENELIFIDIDKNIVYLELDKEGKVISKRIINTHIREQDHKIDNKVWDKWADISRLKYSSGTISVYYKNSNAAEESKFTCILWENRIDDVSIADAVKITLKRSSGWGPADTAFNEKLTITKDSIKYKYKPIVESESNALRKWSYKTTNSTFQKLYKEVTVITDEILNWEDKPFVTDIGGTTFVVTYADGTKQKRTFFLLSDDFKECFSLIEKMIPRCEDMPRMLSISEDYSGDLL